MNGSEGEADPTELDAPPGKETPVSPRLSRRSLFDIGVLLAFAASFVTLLTYLGILRFENFYTTNWDLGINQQMLWTTAHGRLLYETGDVEFANVRSFLEVHSTYIAVPFAALYASAPYPSTLFALQAGAFIVSIVPVYLLARRLVGSHTLILLVVVLYATSFPVLSALLYDYHWEAFLPVEFLSFFLLYRARRYAWCLVPLLAGLLTLEVFPFLIGGVSLLIIYEQFRKIGFRWRSLIRNRDLQIAILLLVGMLVAYVAERYIQILVIPLLVGYSGSPGTVPSAITGVFAVHSTVVSLAHSASYWMLMAAAFAFLPLLAPRFLLLTVPWFVYSTFLTPFFSGQYGSQYALVAVATLAVPLVYGVAHLEKLSRGPLPRSLTGVVIGASSILFLAASLEWSPHLLTPAPPDSVYFLLIAPLCAVLGTVGYAAFRSKVDGAKVREPESPSRLWTRPRVRETAIAVSIALFVGFNLAMSPLNTSNFRATSYPGYELSYSANPASGDMAWLTAQIPSDSVVLSSDYLFPYVANNPNAWAVPWYPMTPGNPPNFPYSGSNLPRFVLIDAADWYNFPSSITSELSNPSAYGLVAYIYTPGYPGTISLYERGYPGLPTARFVTPLAPAQYYSSANLSLGQSGVVRSNSTSKFGSVIVSVPISQPKSNASLIWGGPHISLPPSHYTLTVNLSGNASRKDFGGPVLALLIGPSYDPSLYNVSLNASALTPSHWTSVSFPVNLPVAYPDLVFQGYLEYTDGEPNGSVMLNYLEVQG